MSNITAAFLDGTIALSVMYFLSRDQSDYKRYGISVDLTPGGLTRSILLGPTVWSGGLHCTPSTPASYRCRFFDFIGTTIAYLPYYPCVLGRPLYVSQLRCVSHSIFVPVYDVSYLLQYSCFPDTLTFAGVAAIVSKCKQLVSMTHNTLS